MKAYSGKLLTERRRVIMERNTGTEQTEQKHIETKHSKTINK